MIPFMNNEEERILKITEYYANQYEMLPKQIYLTEDQFVVYNGLINFISFYETNKQTTIVKLPNENKESILEYTYSLNNAEFTKKINFNVELDEAQNQIIYKILNPLEALSVINLKIHYKLNKPLSIFNYAEKIYEVSEWGNIAVTENYQIQNIGSQLVGEFGRVDYNLKSNKGGRNAVRYISAKLPLKANNLWYRDEIGNVSSSVAERQWEFVTLDQELRFPLLGGWKSNYNIGYSLPTKFFINYENDLKTLNLTFGIPYEDIIAANYTYKVILPENAVVHDVELSIDTKYKLSYDKYYSYLDLFGRTQVTITMDNAFSVHNIPILVS